MLGWISMKGDNCSVMEFLCPSCLWCNIRGMWNSCQCCMICMKSVIVLSFIETFSYHYNRIMNNIRNSYISCSSFFLYGRCSVQILEILILVFMVSALIFFRIFCRPYITINRFKMLISYAKGLQFEISQIQMWLTLLFSPNPHSGVRSREYMSPSWFRDHIHLVISFIIFLSFWVV